MLVNQGVYFCPPITYHYLTHLCFSSIFFSHTLNEGLHPVCAFLTHRFRDMAIAIEGERCGICVKNHLEQRNPIALFAIRDYVTANKAFV